MLISMPKIDKILSGFRGCFRKIEETEAMWSGVCHEMRIIFPEISETEKTFILQFIISFAYLISNNYESPAFALLGRVDSQICAAS